MEEWKGGRVEEWKGGRMEGWKNGRVEGWEDGRCRVLWGTPWVYPGAVCYLPTGKAGDKAAPLQGALMSHCVRAEIQLLVSNIDDPMMLEEEIGAQ